MIEWSKLTQYTYWFEGLVGDSSITPPLENGSFFYWFILISVNAIFVLGVALRASIAFLDRQHPLGNKLDMWASNITWIGILGIFWFLCRQLSVGFLSSRFWLIILALWMLVLLGFIIRYFAIYFKIEYLYFKQLQEKTSSK